MELSLGFLVFLFLVLFPGLLLRRLYYYGAFSKQFGSGKNLITILAISSIPGLINLILIYTYYENFILPIDIGAVVDEFKKLNNPNFSFGISEEATLKSLLFKALPFIGFLYLNSLIFGLVSGRFIRNSNVDTVFKLLRYKNYWFYLFNGKPTGSNKKKKLKFNFQNRKHVFTKADILIDAGSETNLYSGIVVDYELSDKDCTSLDKIVLQEAIRYRVTTSTGTSREAVNVPGDLFIVDCTKMRSLNLTYATEETNNILSSKVPGSIETILGLIYLALIPIFIFQATSIEWSIYTEYFQLVWYKKIFAYLLCTQTISLLNPFFKKDDGYIWFWQSWKKLIAKPLWILLMLILLYLIF